MVCVALMLGLGSCSGWSGEATSPNGDHPSSTSSTSISCSSTSTTFLSDSTITTFRSPNEPSQSPENAQRDGVLADLAALPLQLRSHPLVTIESEEGTWVLSEVPRELGGGVLGDSSGDYGVDFIHPYEYGELLLVGRNGDIDRAYPMTAFPPSWLLVTDHAVYAGRVGDGALPWSAIGQVDRATLDAQFLIFPYADTQYDFWQPDWKFAPDDYDQPPVTIAGMDAAPTDPFAQAESWMGNVHVNLEEVQKLFTEN